MTSFSLTVLPEVARSKSRNVPRRRGFALLAPAGKEACKWECVTQMSCSDICETGGLAQAALAGSLARRPPGPLATAAAVASRRCAAACSWRCPDPLARILPGPEARS